MTTYTAGSARPLEDPVSNVLSHPRRLLLRNNLDDCSGNWDLVASKVHGRWRP
jgi:hypothetical protein